MATSIQSPYDLLGANQSSNDYQLRVAYRARIQEFKQDRKKANENRKISPEHFRLICRAYETLGDYTKKKIYDGPDKKWTSSILLSKYTFQQLAAEPDLIRELKNRLENATLKQIDEQDPVTGHTPLYCASRACNIEGVIFLIEQGANPDLPQKRGSTALHVSAFYGHPEIVRLILECGANYLTRNSFGKGNLAEDEIVAEDVETKQIFAQLKQEPYVQVAANQFDWLKANIESIPTHIDEQYYRLRQTLLHCASKKGYLDLVKWLVEERQCNLDIVDINLNSALHLACYGGHSSIVEYLINQGANSLLINKWGMTAEQEGLIHKNLITEIFKKIRQQNIFDMATQGKDWWFKYHFGSNSPNATNNEGTNLLYIACRSGQLAVAKWLLEHGADVNLQLTGGSRSTPLHGAAFGKHLAIVELLLEHGADVNIKNHYGETVFENAKDEKLIMKLLNKYRSNLKDDKFLSVHLYGDGKKSGDAPLAKVELHYEAKYTDLVEALPEDLKKKFLCFSIARRPLIFDKDDTTVLSAFCGARCGKTKFIEMPLCITAHESPRYMNSGHVVTNFEIVFDSRDFQAKFLPKSQNETIRIRGQYNQTQTFQFDKFSLIFAANCSQNDLTIELDYVLSPDNETFQLPECVCLFQTKYPKDSKEKLNDLPIVSFDNQPYVYLYNWIQPSPFWFATSTKHKRLPLIGGRHALIRHVQIIPKELYLLPDMFIRPALGQLFTKRTTPVDCLCLKIREHNKKDFPHLAYHGTTVKVIPSILMDGLVMPSTVVSSGIRVCPPPNHIARQLEAFGTPDFSNGIFLSPSIHYCSDPAYAVTFSNGDQRLIAVFECSVKENSFKSFPSTVPNYKAKPTDDIKNIEWRFTNPAAIQIISILFIPVIASCLGEAKSRAKKLSIDPNAIK